MEIIDKSGRDGFENLFVLSISSLLALLALILVSAGWSILVLVVSLPISMVAYKHYKGSIDSSFVEQGLTSKSAQKLAVAYFYAQGLVVGAVFSWRFGRVIFS